MGRVLEPVAEPSRRGRLALQAGVLTFAVVASCVLLVVLAAAVPVRFDVTATRRHQLSPQSRAVLSKLTEPVDLIVAADFSAVDRLTRERALDALSTFAAGSKLLKTTLIDTASPTGIADYDRLLAELAKRSEREAGAQRELVLGAVEAAERGSTELSGTAESLERLRDAVGQSAAAGEQRERYRGYWNEQAAAARVLAADLNGAAGRARRLLEAVAAPLPVPPLDEAARAIGPALSTLATGLTTLNGALEAFARNPASAGVPREMAAGLAAGLVKERDSAARRAAEVEGLPTLPIISVARAVQRTRAVLLVAAGEEGGGGARRVVALDPETVLPSLGEGAVAGGGGVVDVRSRTEELLAAGLAALTNRARPVVVFVHGADRRVGPGFAPLRRIVDQLALRGMDVQEWAAAVDAEPPAPLPPAPGEPLRPVVYAALGMDVDSPDSAKRMSALAGALSRLIGTGKNVLVSVNPSLLPGAGASDPMVEPLAAVGIAPDSGRPLLEEVPGGAPGAARQVSRDQLLTDPGSTHPIAGAVAPLRTRLAWPIPLALASGAALPAGVKVEPVVTVPARAGLWAESEWYVRPGASVPANDSPRDSAGGPGPWVLAAAAERDHGAGPGEGAPGTQRVVVVGSGPWFLQSTLTREQGVIDGRLAMDAPGNAELFLASVAWLAGQDDAMSRGATAEAVPTIPNLSPAQRGAFRWAFIAGLPLSILLTGAIWRIWRR
jgi:hypothetical protein